MPDFKSRRTYIFVTLLFLISVMSSAEAVSWLVTPPRGIPTLAEKVGSLAVGDHVTFGHYEQDNKTSNGKELIEWRVLDVDENKVLLLSEYGLDSRPYNKKRADVTWETCTLRKWLNNNFLSVAFSSEEQSAILTTEVDNSQSQGWEGLIEWNETGYTVSTKGGNNTNDKVFLLSLAEVQKYFTEWYRNSIENLYPYKSDEILTKPTAYAKAQGAGTITEGDIIHNGCCWWSLRSPGGRNYQHRAALVGGSGWLDYANVDDASGAIRPALWVNSELIGKSTPISTAKSTSAPVPETNASAFDTYVLPNGTVAITAYHGSDKNVRIPATINGRTVTVIGENAFRKNTKLKEVDIPEGVIEIESCAFYSCNSLMRIKLPSSLVTIGANAFSCSQHLEEWQYVEMKLPIGLKTLGDAAFSGLKLRSVTIPGSMRQIEGNPFSSCESLEEILADPNQTSFYVIGNVLFSATDQTMICYPAGLKDKVYEIPDGTRKIGRSAFPVFGHLKEIRIPESVEWIPDKAFYNRGFFVAVYQGSYAEQYCRENNVNYSLIPVESQVYSKMERETPADQFEVEEMEDGTLAIKKYTGKEALVLVPAEIGGRRVTSIAADAFSKNPSLYSVVLPDGITSIGRYAFYTCIHLKEVILPETLTVLGKGAFYDCSALEEIWLPEALESCEDYPFYGCTKLTIMVPKGKSFPGIDYGAHRMRIVSPSERPTALSLSTAKESTPSDRTNAQGESRKGLPASAENEKAIESYYEFLVSGKYRSTGEKYYFGNDGKNKYPRFALYDMDRDGITELIADNNSIFHFDQGHYVYCWKDQKIQFAGRIGGETGVFFYPQDEYPGLFTYGGGMGYYTETYRYLENGEVKMEWVYNEYTVDDGEHKKGIYQATEDDRLYGLDINGDRQELKFYTPDEIRNMSLQQFRKTDPTQ